MMKKIKNLETVILYSIIAILLGLIAFNAYTYNSKQTELLYKIQPLIEELDTTSYSPKAKVLEDSIKNEFVKYWCGNDTSDK